MTRHCVELRAAYADTDQMGFVHHSSYVKYLEYARWEVFRQLGMSYRSIEENGILMPVIGMNMQFIKPLRYDDLIKIELSFTLSRATKLEVEYHIFNESHELIHQASTTLAFLKKSSKKPCAIPEYIHNKLTHEKLKLERESKTLAREISFNSVNKKG